MDHILENGILTLPLVGQVDSSNAPEVEKEILALREEFAHEALVLDFQQLRYISSAGLRIILRLRKMEPEMKLVNVSAEVYDVLDMTGFTEIVPVQKAYRQFSVEGCEIIGRGANGIVYRIDKDTVIKVYKRPDCLPDVQRERELARKAFVLGIPTAIPYDVVKVGESFGSMFELLNSKSFSKLIAADPSKMETYAGLFVDVMKKMHSTHIKPGDMPEMKAVALDWAAFMKDHLPADQGEKLYRMVAEVPERDTMLHGDYHTNNVVVQNDEVLLIDMDTLCVGHPIFELASVYMAFVGFGETDPSIIENFLKMPAATAKAFWEKCLRLYLDTEDDARVRDVETKARILAYTRLMRRTIRRNGYDTDEGRAIIALCRKHFDELLPLTDSLTF